MKKTMIIAMAMATVMLTGCIKISHSGDTASGKVYRVAGLGFVVAK